MQVEPLCLELEFVRKSSASDPYEFQFTPQDYILRRGLGEYDEAHFPWTPELLQTLEEVRLPGRSPDKVQQLGDLLRQFLSTTGWATSEALILSAVDMQRPVILTFRSAAAELYALPWELMTLQRGGQHLGELPSVLLRYAWPDVSAAPEESDRAPGGRILFGWSAAAGAVPALEHQQALVRACAQAEHPFEPENDVLPNLSCGRLIQALEHAMQSGQPVSVLHLLCHGAAVGSSFGLAFHDDSALGELVVVDAARLRQLLAPYAAMIRLVVLSACDSGNSGALGNHLGSVAQAMHRVKISQVVASRFPLSVGGSITLTETFYDQLLGKFGDVAQAFRFARQKLAQDPTELDWAAIQLYSASDPSHARPIVFCPYPGLRAFGSQQRHFFFGRQQESELLAKRFLELAKTQLPRLLAVIGPSGSGKTSLLCAGAIPRILSRLSSAANVTVLSPGTQPMQALERACASFTSSGPQLLVIDQLEDLFTQDVEESEQRSFCHSLWRLITSESTQVSALIALRSDFIAQAKELVLNAQGQKLDSLLASERHALWLSVPSDSALQSAVTNPAERVGLRLEAGLVDRIVEELVRQPGALPLLQILMEHLWQRRVDNRLTQEALADLLGVIGMLLAHAEQVIDSLDAEQVAIAQRLLLRLGVGWTSSKQPSRRRVPISQLLSGEQDQRRQMQRVLDHLIKQRLLIADSMADAKGVQQACVEVAHDALLSKWPRLMTWVDKARPMLAVRENLDRWVAEWHSHNTLLSGSQLGYAVQMAAQFPEAVEGDARELLTQSERTRAEEEELKLRGLDTLRLLAAKSVFGADYTRIVSALIATRSKQPTTIPGWLEASVEILHNQVLCTAEIEHSWGIVDARFGPDGQSVVLAGLDGTAQIWDLGATTLRQVGGDHAASLYRASYSPDGESILTLCADGTARVWSASSGALLVQLVGHKAEVLAGVWSRDGRTIATASADQTARLFEVKSGKQLAVLSGSEAAVMGVAFSPDGQRVYTASSNGLICAFEKAEKGKWSRTDLLASEVELTSLAICNDGTKLATGSSDCYVRVYDLSNLEGPIELEGHTAGVSMVTFSPDGDRLISCSSDCTALLWDLRWERPVCKLSGHRMVIHSASFSRDGKHIVTACGDGRARIWDATRAGLDNPKLIKGRVVPPAGLIPSSLRLVPPSSPVTSTDGCYQATVIGPSVAQIDSLAESGSSFTIDAAPESLTGLCFTSHGDRLILIAQHRILICDLPSRSVRQLLGHTYNITCFAVSPDNQRLITGAEDWTARIWSLAGAAAPRVLPGHEENLVLVSFDEDSRQALTVEKDGATRLWPEEGPSIILLPKERPDHTVGVTPDWRTLVTQTSDRDTPCFLWNIDLTPSALQSRLRSAARLELTAEELSMLYL